jgi:hypothetical protein
VAEGTEATAAERTTVGPIAAAEETASAVRRSISEDWAATVLGLVLLGLALIGVITKALVP